MDDKNEIDIDVKTCQCPPKPWWPPGSMAAGSAAELHAEQRWEAKHGHHANAESARNPPEEE